MPLTPRHLPLLVLTACGTWVTAAGLVALWTTRALDPPLWPAVLLVALALHLAWVLNGIERRAAGLVAIAWLVTVGFCAGGFDALGLGDHPFWYALLLQTILLLTALSMAPRASWAERLARWRRARAAVEVQLKMGDGLVPWIRAAAAALVSGRAGAPVTIGFDRVAAELADTAVTLRSRVARLALPEALRQTLLTAAQAVVPTRR